MEDVCTILDTCHEHMTLARFNLQVAIHQRLEQGFNSVIMLLQSIRLQQFSPGSVGLVLVHMSSIYGLEWGSKWWTQWDTMR